MPATTVTIAYQAYRSTSGLTDVKVDIYDANNSQLVSQATMTEIGSTGVYTYRYTPVSIGTHTWIADSATTPSQRTDQFDSDYTATLSTSSTSTTTYATTEELVSYLKLDGVIPDIESTGTARPRETLGTGDQSTTIFYTDKARVIAETYTFSYGNSESSRTDLVETTDYVLNKDNGTLTLTGTGVTSVGTANIYGEYTYSTIKCTDSQYQSSLDKAQADIDHETHTHFANSTDTTPDWVQVTNEEKHRGEGRYRRDYYSDFYPLPDVSASVAGTAVSEDDTTIYVDSTQGFPSSGVFALDGDKIDYTGKTSTTFTGCTNVSSDHSVAKVISPHVFEISVTHAGSDPVWTVLRPDTEYDVELDVGRFHVYKDDFMLGVFNANRPPQIPNRIRFSYLYGQSTIPDDIKRAALMIASKDMIYTTVRKSHITGKNDFDPTLVNVDKTWIQKTINNHKCIRIINI